MEQVIYRELKKKDYPEIENLIVNSFGLNHYLTDEVALSYMKHAYLQGCLAEQTFCRIAELNGKVVGVIMGKANNQYKIGHHIIPFCAALWHNLRMELVAKRNGFNIKDYQYLHKIYHDFLKESPVQYDGTLSLFAVDAKCRGFGVGTTLLNKMEEYYRSCGVKKIYLYTDSTCNTNFYDRHGFLRAAQKDLSMKQDNKPLQLNVFLYEKIFEREDGGDSSAITHCKNK